MFLIKSSPYILCVSLPALLLMSSCQVSDQWAPPSYAQNFTMNHAPSRPAPLVPVAHPVPAPQRVSVAAVDRVPPARMPLPTFRDHRQAAAIRDSRPPWTESVASFSIPSSPGNTPAFQPSPPAITKGRVRLVNGLAIAPPDAPPVVHRAVAAGNRLQKMPYKWGGGHARLNDTGYDCSGTVSYVLREAGLLKGQMPSRGFFKYGEAGEGEWITVWVRDGHVFMIIGGMRLDTGGSTRRTGPRWKEKRRSYKGFVPRHPRGL